MPSSADARLHGRRNARSRHAISYTASSRNMYMRRACCTRCVNSFPSSTKRIQVCCTCTLRLASNLNHCRDRIAKFAMWHGNNTEHFFWSVSLRISLVLSGMHETARELDGNLTVHEHAWSPNSEQHLQYDASPPLCLMLRRGQQFLHQAKYHPFKNILNKRCRMWHVH